MGPFGIFEILVILALVIFLLGFIYSLARHIWIKRRMKKDGERKANEDKLVKEIEKRFEGKSFSALETGEGNPDWRPPTYGHKPRMDLTLTKDLQQSN